MRKFDLKSEYEPCGDQPQAINKLSKGVLKGLPYQTLLGVTGSGKSVTGETPVLLRRRGKAGFYPIAQFIDEMCQKYSQKIIKHKKSEIILSSQLEEKDTYETLSLNPITKECEWKPVSQLIRHVSPQTLYHIRTTCGREITVTNDHNFWVLRNGKIFLLSTDRIKKTDYLPLPTEIPEPKQGLNSIDIVEILKKEQLFVDAEQFISKVLLKRKPREIIYSLNKNYAFPQQKFFEIKNGSSPGVPLTTLSQIASELKINFSSQDLERIVIGSQIHQYSLPGKVPLSSELLRLIGYYIAEGHAEQKHRFFSISTNDTFVRKELKNIFDKLGLSYRQKGFDFIISSKIHTVLLATLVGPRARSKRLPGFWPQLSQKQLSTLLRAYFEGDGGNSKSNGVVTPTASKQLASDIGCALLRFGIWSRTYRIWQWASNSPRQKRRIYWYITISGRENLLRFRRYIGFKSSKKQKSLRGIVKCAKKTNVDSIPGVGFLIKELRTTLGATQQHLASLSGVSRATLAHIELGINNPRRTTFKKIIKGLKQIGGKKIKIEKLRGFLNCKWTKIAEIEPEVKKNSYVYDFGVQDNETFLAGYGGLFVHNTFTMAEVIKKVQKPTLVISPNKTLCAQLYREFKELFPYNAVEYFVSYYDYYQPEAYIPHTDTYIEKDASINEEIDKLRLSATSSVMSRNDVIVVASVSCIYNLGSPADYKELLLFLQQGDKKSRREILEELVAMLYERNDMNFIRGKFRVRGDIVEIFPSYEEKAIRVELFGDEIEKISYIDPLTGNRINEVERVAIYPAKHFLTTKDKIERALISIKEELRIQVEALKKENKLLQAQRLQSRTQYDMEMFKEVGYCHGIENYSRHLSGRAAGSRPYCLIDYFGDDFITFIDESHVTVPQLRGMYTGDKARKENLVQHGFRLPSALDNRPLKLEEFEELVPQTVYVSATPSDYEIAKSNGRVIEQVIRPTGLIDPNIEVKPTKGQIDDLVGEIKERADNNERTLVTTLTKRMAEDLSLYLKDIGIKVDYIHSEIDTIQRVEILKDLRLKKYDCLVGVNLLREGLDLPEVTLVAILDADKEGFLRSQTSLIQVAGRAARNVNGKVIMYAEEVTNSMKKAIQETKRRRKKQIEFNQENNITPQTIQKSIKDYIEVREEAEEIVRDVTKQDEEEYEREVLISELEHQMEVAARNLQFEKAAELRDKVKEIKKK